ncbi:MAG: dTDP-4-dehydrorhamnose reductase [Gammaproteobacteria bacterium (ex Lamellibrachia satsuma)]|nr:MAG: dTDP-4-dehydrorhamnose reductase [Gammaproteobacteria bacterium (ex Lamellibrachia satsuma)]RRS33627.1 MAG: dTDP-4-dehydrorhamnose reductase [Gammaproteobacteria bacterium (ex Lamellibrachia satsuma)]RRS34806.1 MAG: dTDP-4-dehydrorhamnose reductase [Gammaproteobacteria bacterium (ex Lamellibrachia satsuma)]
MKKTRFLIIGDQGQVGWELQRSMATLGDVIAIGRRTKSSILDLVDPDVIRKAVREINPDWIINAAAYTSVDKAEEEHELAMAVNGTAPGILAEEAKAIKATLIHYSTDYVFDGKATEPYKEESPTNPLSVYGKTKLAGEKAVEAVDGRYLIFRTSWVYGNRGQNFLMTMRRLAQEREGLKIVDDQYGAPTWCRHIAEATSQAVSQCVVNPDLVDEKRGLYHLSSDGMTTWYGFSRSIFELMREADEKILLQSVKPIATEEYPLPAPRPGYSVLDNAKLRHHFGLVLPDWELVLAQVMK